MRRGNKVVEIRLAHFSIKEYLLSERITQGPAENFSITEKDAHLHIADSCLAYHIRLSETEIATKETIQRFRLWEYVVNYWTKHLDHVPQRYWRASIISHATQVFTPSTKSLLNMVRINRSHKKPDWELGLDMLPTPLYYGVSIGALRLTEFLIEKGARVDEISQFGRFGTALQVAASVGNKSIVQVLLDNSADVNAQGGKYGTALQAAAFMGHKSIVQVLLNNGANINAQGGKYGTALQAAAFMGHKSIVQVLLNNGANINAQGGKYGTALQAAAFRGHKSIVQVLLNNGANLNLPGGMYGNALQAAIARCNYAAVELLLSRGAKVDPPGAEWDALLAGMVGYEYAAEVERLREFQEDPQMYLAKA